MAQDYRRMHDHLGFTIEPVIGGYVIAIYGVRHTLYLGGPSGGTLTENTREARVFRTPEICHEKIDEIIKDHDEWMKSCKGRTVKINDLINPNEPF